MIGLSLDFQPWLHIRISWGPCKASLSKAAPQAVKSESMGVGRDLPLKNKQKKSNSLGDSKVYPERQKH